MGGVRNLAFPCSLGKPTDLGRNPERNSGGHAIPIPIPPLVVLNFQERVQNKPPTTPVNVCTDGTPHEHTLSPIRQINTESIMTHPPNAKLSVPLSSQNPRTQYCAVIYTYGICRVYSMWTFARTYKKRKGRSRDQNNEAKDS